MAKHEALKKAGMKRKVFLSTLENFLQYSTLKKFIAEGGGNKNRKINMVIMRSCGFSTYFVRWNPWLRFATDQT